MANGAFFVPLTMCCRKDEHAIAIDTFEDRHKHWNPYGGSSGQDFIKQALSTNGSTADVRFIKGDSFHITAAKIHEAGSGQPVRLFSVDGSHSTHHTVHDLQIAGEVVSEGAVVFLDDVKNW